MAGTQGLRPGLHSYTAAWVRKILSWNVSQLHAYRVLYWHRGQPVEAVGHLAANNAVELVLDGARDRSHHAFPDADLIDRANWRYFRCRAAEENFVRQIEQFARYALFDHRNSEVARNGQDGIASNARQDGVPEGSRLNHAVADHEHILARTFADVSIHVERNAFDVAIDNGFHLDQLRVHVIGARFCHCRQSVRCEAGPGRNANVHALLGVAAKVFAPGIVANVHLGWRVEGIDAGLAVAAKNNGTDVARPHGIVLYDVKHAADDVFATEVDINAVNLGGVQQTLNMFTGAEDGGSGRQSVTADALEHGGAVVHHMGHDVELRVIPGDELAVVPDFFCLLNRHWRSLQRKIRCNQ